MVKYSGHTVELHQDYPELLLEIEKKVEDLLCESFNHVMLNRYESGKEYIGKHRDTKENKVIQPSPSPLFLAPDRVFFSGHRIPESRRRAYLHHASEQAKARTLYPQMEARKRKFADHEGCNSRPLEGWCYGLSYPGTSFTDIALQHEIPKEPSIKEERISLTFRQLVPSRN